MRRKRCFDRIDQVVSHYQTAVQAVRLLIRLAEDQPKYLRDNNLDLNELRALLEEFHEVYFARMFACFEADLRHFWRTTVRDTKPLTEQLLSSIAGRRTVPQDVLAAVHEIREFRNYLLHEEHEARRPITIDEGSRRMNAFLAWLPLEW